MNIQFSLNIFQRMALFVSLLFAFCPEVHADDKSYSDYTDAAYVQYLNTMYKKMSKYPSDKLTRMGLDMFEKRQEYDSATVCLAIVKNRYEKHLSIEQKRLCIAATSASGYLALYHYYDYARAYDCFDKALKISEEIDARDERPRLYLNLGSMLLSSGYHFNSKTMLEEAKDYFEMGLDESYGLKNWGMYVKNFLYYSSLVIMDNDKEEIKSLLGRFKLQEVPDTIKNHLVAQYRVEALQAIADGDNELAVQKLTSEINSDYATLTPERYYTQALAIISEVLNVMGERDRAVAALKKMLVMAEEYNLVDVKTGANRRIADIYRVEGDDKNFALYYNKYAQVKDSLFMYYHMDQVSEKHLLAGLSKAIEMEKKSSERRRMFFFLSVILLVLSVGSVAFALVLRRKNKYLNERNRLLYDRYHEMLQAETAAQEVAENSLQASQGEEKPGTKYRGSSLSEEDKTALVRAIKETLKNTDAICQQSFTIEQMAQMIGSNTRYVSQVINECFGMNFNSLVAEQRVREACRRLDNEAQYGHLTIEAVAQSVGFKSRNSLIAAFKKVTGLTPSEYQKMCKE